MPAQQPPRKSVSWTKNLDKIRPTYEDKGDTLAIDPSPATRDANEYRRISRTPGAQTEGFAKGGKVKATGKAKVHAGEHVIRKRAVRQYGDKKMAAVNQGKAKVTVPKRQ